MEPKTIYPKLSIQNQVEKADEKNICGVRQCDGEHCSNQAQSSELHSVLDDELPSRNSDKDVNQTAGLDPSHDNIHIELQDQVVGLDSGLLMSLDEVLNVLDSGWGQYGDMDFSEGAGNDQASTISVFIECDEPWQPNAVERQHDQELEMGNLVGKGPGENAG